mgnify:CR=1 FL=1
MTTLSTSRATRLPVWADEIRRRYLRGESTQFVLFGTVSYTHLTLPTSDLV